LVDIAKNSGIDLVPVLLDFGVFQSPRLKIFGNQGGGKIDLVIDPVKRDVFLNGTLKKLLGALDSSQRAAIYAFDVMNEPEWEVDDVLFLDINKHGVLGRAELRDFLGACLKQITLPSTVGFASPRPLPGVSARGVVSYPAGTRPQFHYYGPSRDARDAWIPGRYNLPDADAWNSSLRIKEKPFVGEIDGADLVKGPWPSLEGGDLNKDALSVFLRLRKLKEKGYELALLWPDVADKWPWIFQHDELKFTIETQKAIKAFTDGMDLWSAQGFFAKPFSIHLL
jgi:hypothetical protein